MVNPFQCCISQYIFEPVVAFSCFFFFFCQNRRYTDPKWSGKNIVQANLWSFQSYWQHVGLVPGTILDVCSLMLAARNSNSGQQIKLGLCFWILLLVMWEVMNRMGPKLRIGYTSRHVTNTLLNQLFCGTVLILSK